MKKAVRGVARVPGLAKQAIARRSGEPDLLARLAREHAEVTTLLKMIQRERSREVHTDDEGVITRVRLLTTLSLELLAHERAEDEVLYVALDEHEDARTQVGRSREEHLHMERLLLELLSIEYSAPHWLEVFEELTDLVGRHVEDEEQEVFPLLQRHLSRDELEALGERYREVHRDKREKLEGRALRLAGEGREERHAR